MDGAAVVAVRMRELGAALTRLDPQSRALLDLSVRRALPDEEIAGSRRFPTCPPSTGA
jgi:hypothetical protein